MLGRPGLAALDGKAAARFALVLVRASPLEMVLDAVEPDHPLRGIRSI
jgi:hypothetical protein